MSSTRFRDPTADDLLERIRNLKELLKSEEIAGAEAFSRSSGSQASNVGEETPNSQMPRQRHFSPPTRDSPVPRKNSQEGMTSTNEQLIEETWHLLTQVTYVRIVIDRLSWQETPRMLVEELKKPKMPRQKSLVILEYCFPVITSGDGSVSARDLGKRVVVPAKEVLSKVVHFNHRRVVLVRMTQPILQLWSQSCFIIKIFCGKKPNMPIGKCIIPLCKLLVLPFSFDADVVMEPTSDHMKCSGKLKICIQLGSRFQSFTERVEPMRNPTTALNEFTFIDPMKLVAQLPAAADKPASATLVAASPQKDSEPISARNVEARLPSTQRSQESWTRPRTVERRLNETFSEEPHGTPSRFGQVPPSWRSNDYEHVDNEPAWLRMLLARRGDSAVTSGRGSESGRAEPYVSNISVYGNRATAFGGGFKKEDERRMASVQTEAMSGKKTDAAAQTSEKQTPVSNVMGRGSSAKVGRRPTVAEKILMNRSSFSLEENRESLPPASESHRGFWLQLTIHRARTLPMVKESKNGQTLVKPTCFWTYASETSTCYTPIASESCEPIWEWSQKLFIAPHRKTLVLKLWHRGVEGKDRVLGFVAVLFPITQPFERVWYDIIDLTRSSTGQVEISFAYATAGDEETVPKTIGTVPVHSEVQSGQGRAVDENPLVDTGINTTLQMESDQRRSSCSSPFLALTTRSFLTQKLRTNLEELSTLTAHMRRSGARPIVVPVPVSRLSRQESYTISGNEETQAREANIAYPDPDPEAEEVEEVLEETFEDETNLNC